MDEIRCPMCGKPNPADLDVCQYCQARLKPLTGPISEGPKAEGDNDDWLGSFRSDADIAGTDDEDWYDEDADQQDPLARLSGFDEQPAESQPRPQRQVEPEPESSSTPEPEEEQVDLNAWLASLDNEEEEAPAVKSSSSERPEWLGEIPSAPPEEPENIPAEDLSDWLANLEDDTVEEPQASTVSPLTSEDEERFQYTAEDQNELGEEGLPEWLSSLGKDADSDEQPGRPQPAESEEPAENAVETTDVPEWLADVGQTAGPELQEESPGYTAGEDEEALEAADIPDWISEIGPPGQEITSEPDQAAGEADSIANVEDEPEIEPGALPAWMLALQADEAELPESEEPAGEESAAEEPEAEESAAEEPEAEESAAEEPEAEEPIEWLPEAESAEASVTGSDVAELEISFASEAGEPGETDETQGVETTSPGEMEEEALAPGEMPEWLSEMQPSAEETTASGLETPDLPSPEGDSAGWLSELASEVEGKSEDQHLDEALAAAAIPFALEGESEVEDIFLSEEPDWLADVSKEAAADNPEEGKGEEITPADLPGWLAAMRPVDAVVTPTTSMEEADLDAETSGPLTGLRDVLPAEPDVFQIGKPDALSVRLDVNENQQKHIVLLEKLLNEEHAPRSIEPPARVASLRILRWLIFGILLVAASFSLLRSTAQTELPVPGPEAQAVSTAINGLPAQASVLVAFDYEPGMSGEMDTISSILLDHLMLRGAALTILSTTPTGPAQAETVIQNLQSKHNYSSGIQYVDLGYLPGGTTGLQTLAYFPMRLLLPYTFSGYEAWQPRLAPLANIENISDFALVLVLTDREQTARAWIEQIGPQLKVPFLIGASAQVAPLVRPYYASAPNLVDGFVAGLAGSGGYERLIGVSGQARKYWDTFSLLVLVSAGVILIGGLVVLALGGIRQAQPAKGEQAE